MQTKFLRLASFIIFFLIIANFLNLYLQFSELVNLYLLSEFAKDSSINTSLIFIFLGFQVVLTVLIFAILYTYLSKKEKETVEKIEKKEVKHKVDSEEEGVREQQEKRIREEARKNAVIERILKELDSQSTLKKYADKFLSNLAREYDIVQGLFFIKDPNNKQFKMMGNYAYYSETSPREFKEGEGISGQVAKNKKLIDVMNVPDGYITIISGLGSSSPKHLLIFPIIYNDDSVGIIELASFRPFDDEAKQVFMLTSKIVGQQIQSRF
jgi:Na+-transporting methylmalonyl-CoA/oxaloacetate decarboxylase gamma subunit